MTAPQFLSGAGEIAQDWRRLADHLADHGMVLATEGNDAPKQFSSGYGNLNYLIHVDGAPRVLRRPPMGPIQPGANDMGRESRILMRLWKHFPLAPRCHHFSDDEKVLGAPFFIMEYRPGLVIGGTLPDGIADDAGQRLGPMMAAQLASFHAVDPADVDLDTLGKPEGYLSRTFYGWMKRADAAWEGNAPGDLGAIGDWLEARVPPDGDVTLLHNDFKLDNMILDPETLDPIALIDWDMGTRGHPLWDFAVLLSYWVEPDDPQVMLELDQMPTAGHGFPSREEMAGLYAKASGRSLEHLPFMRILAILRCAVIFQQLYQRYVGGGTDDPRFARFGETAKGLLAFAVGVSEEKYF